MNAVQHVPETSGDERPHILDETCWCNPDVHEIRADFPVRVIRRTVRHRTQDAQRGKARAR